MYDATKDDSMCQVFRRGDDLHSASAAALLGSDIADLRDADRQVGKTFNFLTIYGGGAAKAAKDLEVPIARARELQQKFHEAWPGVRKLHNPPFRNGEYARGEGPGAIQRRLKQKGYITTLFGRHLHPHSPHVALNALVQGCAADLMRWSLIQIHTALEEAGCQSKLVNVVHDEAILDCVADELPFLTSTIPGLMAYPVINEVVPVEVDNEISYTTWADKESFIQAAA